MPQSQTETPEQFEAEMRALFPYGVKYDVEESHGKADELMCDILESLGYGDGVHVFQDAKKWYG